MNGFTGTPENRFKFIDPLEIKPKNPESIKLEQTAINKNCVVIEYTVKTQDIKNYTENYDYITFILDNVINDDIKYNVIIDVGALFINIMSSINVEFNYKEINLIIVENVLKMLERRGLIDSWSDHFKKISADTTGKTSFNIEVKDKKNYSIYLVNAKLK